MDCSMCGMVVINGSEGQEFAGKPATYVCMYDQNVDDISPKHHRVPYRI